MQKKKSKWPLFGTPSALPIWELHKNTLNVIHQLGGKSIITIFFHLRNKKKIWYYKTFKNFSPPNFISDFSCVLYLFLKFITSFHIPFLLQFFFKNNYSKKKIFSWILLLFTVRNENCSIWHQHIAAHVYFLNL